VPVPDGPYVAVGRHGGWQAWVSGAFGHAHAAG